LKQKNGGEKDGKLIKVWELGKSQPGGKKKRHSRKRKREKENIGGRQDKPLGRV